MKYDVKYSKGYLIRFLCITILLIAGTIFITNSFISTGIISSALLQDAKHPNWFYVVMSAIITICDIILIIFCVVFFRLKITVEDNKITVRKTFSTKEYDVTDIDSAHQSYYSYRGSRTLTFTMYFTTPKKLKTVSFNENMLNWTALANKLVLLGKLKKENGKYKNLY